MILLSSGGRNLFAKILPEGAGAMFIESEVLSQSSVHKYLQWKKWWRSSWLFIILMAFSFIIFLEYAAPCQIKCGDLFENDVVGVFNSCAVSQKRCVPQKQDEGEYPLPVSSSMVKSFDASIWNGRYSFAIFALITFHNNDSLCTNYPLDGIYPPVWTRYSIPSTARCTSSHLLPLGSSTRKSFGG